jgi:hypothetical protein
MKENDRFADLVIVPDVVGLPFSLAQDEAYGHGVVLANPDPDGPPIGGIAWLRDPVVDRQDPTPGSVMYRHDSVRVWLRIGPEPVPSAAEGSPPPNVDRAQAIPEPESSIIDVTSDEPS